MRNKIMFMLMTVVLFMSGGHLLDIGQVAMDTGYDRLGNGFFDISARQVKHLGYYMMYMSFMFILAGYLIFITPDPIAHKA